MDDLVQRAIQFLQSRFPQAPVFAAKKQLIGPKLAAPKDIHFLVAHDIASGVKQCLLAITDFGANFEDDRFCAAIKVEFDKEKTMVSVGGGNRLTGHTIEAHEMVDSPRILIYTNELNRSRDEMLKLFEAAGQRVDIIVEAEMYVSAFVSYGAHDEKYAKAINRFLEQRGVKTFLFADDAVPGQKLHRLMWNGASSFDRVVLLCSKSSLDRPGVLNEIERVLEREAREGGSDVLIPISIDCYVLDGWKPEREDVAQQIRSRVVTIFPPSSRQSKAFLQAAEKLLTALRRG